MSASGEWIINGKLTDSCEKQRGSETTKVEKVRKIRVANDPRGSGLGGGCEGGLEFSNQ